jgi:hypothetical protein
VEVHKPVLVAGKMSQEPEKGNGITYWRDLPGDLDGNDPAARFGLKVKERRGAGCDNGYVEAGLLKFFYQPVIEPPQKYGDGRYKANCGF